MFPALLAFSPQPWREKAKLNKLNTLNKLNKLKLNKLNVCSAIKSKIVPVRIRRSPLFVFKNVFVHLQRSGCTS